jgi:hypothetical protein
MLWHWAVASRSFTPARMPEQCTPGEKRAPSSSPSHSPARAAPKRHMDRLPCLSRRTALAAFHETWCRAVTGLRGQRMTVFGSVTHASFLVARSQRPPDLPHLSTQPPDTLSATVFTQPRGQSKSSRLQRGLARTGYARLEERMRCQELQHRYTTGVGLRTGVT